MLKEVVVKIPEANCDRCLFLDKHFQKCNYYGSPLPSNINGNILKCEECKGEMKRHESKNKIGNNNGHW